jgi:hypothetical protein
MDLPLNKKPITIKWVYKVKTHANGITTKFKGRLVARGFQQQASEDFKETYVPITKYNTLRAMIALTSHNGWPIYHLDVKTTFLNGELIEEVYIKQLEGFQVKG